MLRSTCQWNRNVLQQLFTQISSRLQELVLFCYLCVNLILWCTVCVLYSYGDCEVILSALFFRILILPIRLPLTRSCLTWMVHQIKVGLVLVLNWICFHFLGWSHDQLVYNTYLWWEAILLYLQEHLVPMPFLVSLWQFARLVLRKRYWNLVVYYELTMMNETISLCKYNVHIYS